MDAAQRPGVNPPWTILSGRSPLVATAIHAGHELRSEIASRIALGEAERRREEDPFTDAWVSISGSTSVVVHRSRFEVDLNRPPDGAVYKTPDDAWGLRVWRQPPGPHLVAGSLDLHRTFYQELDHILRRTVECHGRAVVLDLHSYNHRREGPRGPAADPGANPEVNLGTGTLPERWRPVAAAFASSLARRQVGGHPLDVRENVRFRGGFLSRWLHAHHGENACAIAVEVKKTFMDEWTGEPYPERIREIGTALAAAAEDLEGALAA